MSFSYTISPSIDQGAALNFQDSFYALAQRTESDLVKTKAIIYLPSKGKTNNFARIGRIELEEVAGRNPDKAYGDYALDNRQFTKRRFTRTITLDKKNDINELLSDPTSSILVQLDAAKERTIDRVAIAAAVGNVLVGAPDVATSSISAATDGVITIDATAGCTYDIVQAITQTFINNEVPAKDFRGSTLCITGVENTDLMGEDQFINQDYIKSLPVDLAGVMTQAGTYNVAVYAGSSTGGGTIPQPYLPETSTQRTCVALAPGSIAMAIELGDMGVSPNPNKVNSIDITIDLWINAMRTEGVKVVAFTTTI